MDPLEQQIDEILNAYKNGNLSVDEKNDLLEEIKNVRIAQECADDEVRFRKLVELCKFAKALVL